MAEDPEGASAPVQLETLHRRPIANVGAIPQADTLRSFADLQEGKAELRMALQRVPEIVPQLPDPPNRVGAAARELQIEGRDQLDLFGIVGEDALKIVGIEGGHPFVAE